MTPTKPTILLVEDYADTRYILKLLLEQQGYTVVEAEDGQQAVDLALREHPDLILMDLNMPVLNGWDAARKLRYYPEMRELPIIGISAHCKDNWYEEAIGAGFNDCLQKPIMEGKLEEALSKFLSR